MNYPTVAEVQAADRAQLVTWQRNLPPPQTDVERTVVRRITRKLAEQPFDFNKTFKEVFGE